MAEVTIKATKIEDILKDADLIDAICEDLGEIVGDAEGIFVCTAEVAITLINDACEEEYAVKAVKKLEKLNDQDLVVFNSDNIPG